MKLKKQSPIHVLFEMEWSYQLLERKTCVMQLLTYNSLLFKLLKYVINCTKFKSLKNLSTNFNTK